jgi:rare lipoprotein A (peptidoglycan hydrolase)
MLLTRTLAAAALCLALSPAQANPAARLLKVESTGRLVASVYWEGERVATGKKFDPSGMTVAHRSLPLGTRLVVSYGRNCAEVIVNDRGPFVRGREIDLTQGVAHALHFPGLGKVRVVYWPPLPPARPAKLIELSDD